MKQIWDPDIYHKAWLFATLAHDGQFYGGHEEGLKIPYINHVGSVAMEVSLALSYADHEYDADLAIQCALLHDVIEDTPYTYQELQDLFGSSVASGVAALSKIELWISKSDQMLDSLQRIQQQPVEVAVVKLADRICNLSTPPFYWSAEKILAYATEAKVIYQHLKSAHPQLAQRLFEKIQVYPRFANK